MKVLSTVLEANAGALGANFQMVCQQGIIGQLECRGSTTPSFQALACKRHGSWIFPNIQGSKELQRDAETREND